MVRNGFRSRHDLHSVFFPFDYYMSLRNTYKLYEAADSLLLNQVGGNIKYDIRRECKCVFFGHVLFSVIYWIRSINL